MPASLTRTEVLRLHTDAGGCVWYGDDAQLAVNTYMDVSDFLSEPAHADEVMEARTVRVVGSAENAELIVKLDAQRRPTAIPKVQSVVLWSPALVATALERCEPEAVLQYLWQPPYSSCLRGLWHELTDGDLATYSLIGKVRADAPLSDAALLVAKQHPAWPAFSFLPTLAPMQACRLLCLIVDPRWYVHPVRPGRLSRLGSHLGLIPKNAEWFLGNGAPGRYSERFALSLSTWYERGPADRGEPANFLWRVFTAHSTRARGLLRATESFIEFVVAVWCGRVAAARHPEVRGFVAREFFRDRSEAEAFVEHLRCHDRV